MIGDTMLAVRVRLAAMGLLIAGLAGIGSCSDSTGVDNGHDNTGPAALIVSDPTTPGAATGQAALLVSSTASVAPSVTYVSFPPATVPNGVSVTISNRRTAAALTVPFVDGGLDPVSIAAIAGDTLNFAIDAGAAAQEQFSRVVPDFIKVRVVRTDPPPGKVDVPLNLLVRIVFSEPVDPASVTGATLGLEQGGNPVSGKVGVSSDGLEGTFQPTANLRPGTDYTIVVGGGIRDSDGSSLESPVTARFTTGTASGMAVALSFVEQPVDAFTGTPMRDVQVNALDAAGQPASGFTGSITLAIGTNPGGGVLSGTTTRDGPLATFGDLKIDGVGNGYTLVATSSGLNSAVSSAFNVGTTTGLIAYSSYGQGIVLRAADARRFARLGPPDTFEPSFLSAMEPTWSPDGTQLAFTIYDASSGLPDGTISVMNANGTGVTSLSQSGFMPAWSPDGTRIAFAKTVDANKHSQIYVMSVDGSEVVRLTNNVASDYAPAWSPDGTRLAFARSSDGPGFAPDTIYVMNADGSTVTSLGQEGSWPAWSPDGTRIAFSRLVTNPYVGDIYVMGADGSGVTRLTSNQTPANSYDPTWSPDGQRIAFSRSGDPDWEPYSIYVMNADGSGARIVSDDGSGVGRASLAPAWSPR